MPFSAFLRWILPKEDHFYDHLERQAKVAHQAAVALKRLTTGGAAGEIRATVQELEHQGDAILHEMLDALGRTFATPIDRDDLQKLCKRLDDITDMANAAARACVLFGVDKPTPPMCLLIEKLEASTAIIDRTVPLLRHHAYDQVKAGVQEVIQLEKDGDAVFRDAISKLFHDPSIDAKNILREKEVLDDLEKAINRCEQVADALTSIAVKHA
ncbi:MAG: DUF47 family protein [Planctomycetes bacterium]|nr:DUF47 family protein [Planctomycetota bacterium]